MEAGEDPQAAARREFREELGLTVDGTMQALTPRPAYRGKVILPWLAEAALDLSQFESQTVRLAWPPRSGQFLDVPEVDQALYFPLPVALQKVLPAQAPILLEAADLLSRKDPRVPVNAELAAQHERQGGGVEHAPRNAAEKIFRQASMTVGAHQTVDSLVLGADPQ